MLRIRVVEPRVTSRRNAVFLEAFPDRRLTIEDQIAEGDKVASRITMRATHTGDLPGIPATGRTAISSRCTSAGFRMDASREEWEIFDALGMLSQLGASTSQGLSGS